MAACLVHTLYPSAGAANVLRYTKACHDQRVGPGQAEHPSPEAEAQIDFVHHFCKGWAGDDLDSGAMFAEGAGTVLGGRRT